MTRQELPGIFYSDDRPGDEFEVSTAPGPEGWETSYQVTREGADLGSVAVRHTLTGRLSEAYPVGARDLEVEVHTEDPQALWAATHEIFEHDSACRRIVLATNVGDIPAIDFGERAGYRYVVDVEIPGDIELSLLVAEPEWVLKEPRAIETRAGH